MGLLPRVYFLNRAFYPACCALTSDPKLNYKRSAHDEFRVWPIAPLFVDILWS